MAERILVVNAGSSSLKLSLIGAASEEPLAAAELAAPEMNDPDAVAATLASGLGDADAVGHRIVHGGSVFSDPVRMDAEIRSELGALVSLAPLHQPRSLAALDLVSHALGDLPAVACFDTAFHAGMPEAAQTYALPLAWRRRWAIRRYGFHGLSHAWIARRVPELLDGEAPAARIDLSSNGFEIEMELVLSAIAAELSVTEVPSCELPRRAGASHLRVFRDGFRVLSEMLRQRFLLLPPTLAFEPPEPAGWSIVIDSGSSPVASPLAPALPVP